MIVKHSTLDLNHRGAHNLFGAKQAEIHLDDGGVRLGRHGAGAVSGREKKKRSEEYNQKKTTRKKKRRMVQKLLVVGDSGMGKLPHPPNMSGRVELRS